MSLEPVDRDIQFRSISGEQRESLMIQVAKRYYDLGMTMADLAKELGLTRWQASRLLTEARESGIVRIEIMPRAPRLPSLESRLQRRWGLKETVVVAIDGETDERLVLNAVAKGAAQFIAGLGRVPLIGVSWGRTMSAVAGHLPPFWNEGVEVVLLNGAMNIRAPSVRTNNTAELFARSANGTATLLPVPAILGHAATRLALEQDPTIAGVLDLGRRAPVICFGMGTIGPDSVLVQSGFVTQAETAALRGKGAVGDVLSRYIDENGGIVDPAIDERTIALDLRLALSRDLSIGICAGIAKRAVALGCLRARYLNVLVTDEETALSLLDEA
ncbi:sugar-binding transcriptional regulator [Aureimonas sp. AU22]|uniref:sugar-binding transcriptional regulator n=1 Tax=Aureimonas sp. AU22 TaxID=1638162 RepID=UPI00078264EC|nr:sugar-binding transcriptional regulator [Aureimonas sp. AU22]